MASPRTIDEALIAFGQKRLAISTYLTNPTQHIPDEILLRIFAYVFPGGDGAKAPKKDDLTNQIDRLLCGIGITHLRILARTAFWEQRTIEIVVPTNTKPQRIFPCLTTPLQGNEANIRHIKIQLPVGLVKTATVDCALKGTICAIERVITQMPKLQTLGMEVKQSHNHLATHDQSDSNMEQLQNLQLLKLTSLYRETMSAVQELRRLKRLGMMRKAGLIFSVGRLADDTTIWGDYAELDGDEVAEILFDEPGMACWL